jgi:hypothetical protein
MSKLPTVALAALAAAGAVFAQNDSHPTLAIGSPALCFSLPGSAGEQITLRPVRGTGPLTKEHGVWVFRTGQPMSASSTG